MRLLLSSNILKGLIVGLLFVCFGFTTVKQSNAATLASASATLTSSRPSPSSPLSADYTANATQVSVFNNGSRFLASDSAKMIRANGSFVNTNHIVASQSADLTTVFFTTNTTSAAGAGSDVLIAPVTAVHRISFTTVQDIPSSGKIVILYPGSGNNTASPSATTFAFNGLSTGNVVSNPAAGCNSVSITAPTITCTTNALIAAGTTVTVLIGCSAQSNGNCTTQVPTLINPTNVGTSDSSTVAAADPWKVSITTQNASSVQLDNATVSVGIIESVTVRATIDPTLSFTITGITSGAMNTGNTSGCLDTETVNSGVASSGTDVNLGTLINSPSVVDTKVGNIAAQRIDISTNATTGYSLTATASSTLLNVSAGSFLPASLTPASFPAAPGAAFFGLHACGQDVINSFVETGAGSSNCDTYISGSTGGTNNECRYAWPTTNASPSTSPLFIAFDTSGPIGTGSSDPAGDGSISISYAAGSDVSKAPGDYRAIITYVATPSF